MSEIDFILQKVENIFKNDSSGHDYFHTLRVYKNALKISNNEKCDRRIVSISALLHDVDDVKLFNTENFLM